MEQSRREQMKAMLLERPWSLKELAQYFGVPFNVVEDDLVHIEKSVARTHKIKQFPPVCEACGFEFKKRTKFHKPSRCPECRSERISDGTLQLLQKGCQS